MLSAHFSAYPLESLEPSHVNLIFKTRKKGIQGRTLVGLTLRDLQRCRSRVISESYILYR